jgi:hypothetical protein
VYRRQLYGLSNWLLNVVRELWWLEGRNRIRRKRVRPRLKGRLDRLGSRILIRVCCDTIPRVKGISQGGSTKGIRRRDVRGYGRV